MRYSEKDYIAIGFDGDRTNITPVILMNGNSGLKKVLHGISAKKNMEILLIKFVLRKDESAYRRIYRLLI